MKVVILAAGIGRRLSPLTDRIPKTLLKVGGRSILSRLIENYARADFREFIIVTGANAYAIDNEADELQKAHNVDIQIVFNPDYNVANNCLSLLLGIDGLDEPLVVSSSDIVFDKEILNGVLAAHGNALVIDPRDNFDEEDMKVIVKNNRVLDISKNLNVAESFGEHIGISLISRDGLKALREYLRNVVNENPSLYYEDAYRLMFEKVNFGVISTNNLWWQEIDTPEDLKQARKSLNAIKKALFSDGFGQNKKRKK